MKILTANQIEATLRQKNLRVDCLDSKYALPTRKWCKEFLSSLSSQLFNLVGGWRADVFDCDDYAFSSMGLARMMHAKNKTGAALAFGYFQYIDTTQGHHAINFAFTESGVAFFEPQNGTELKLSENEIQSYTRIII